MATLENPPESMEKTIEEFEAAARELISRGADVICTG